MKHLVVCAALLIGAVAAPARADEAPVSLMALFNRIPDLPATAPEAARWVDKRGALVHPGLLALQADIEAHQRAVAQIAQAGAQRDRAQAAIQVDDLGKGLADAGIDMARAQRDPAYAQQVQERLRKLSPQELMAMSQKMAQPMNQDKRLRNAALAVVDDTPAMRAAADAGEAYGHAQLARMNAHEAIWREAEAGAARILSQRLSVPVAKPAMAWDNIGCEPGCRAQWDAYASAMLPLMVARDTEILRVRRAALQRQRAAVAGDLQTADRLLAAAQYGAASQSQVNRTKVNAYDSAAIAELQQLLARLVDSIRSAAVVTHCGPQAVLVPGAVCT